MSETETATPPAETEVPAPGTEQPAPDQQEQQEQQPPEDRRWARLTARFSTLSRERDELAQRVAQLEQTRAPGEQPSPEIQQWVQQEAAKIAEGQRIRDQVTSFHNAGQAAYDDWQERCANLQAMGADAGMAQLLVEMGPDGAKIAGALHDQPDELERISAIKSERGRAIALGQFQARLDAKSPRALSRAPRPPTPVTGRAAPQFNEYAPNLSANDLLDYYRRQDAERRRGH